MEAKNHMRSDKRGEGRGVAFPAAFFCMACVAAALFQAFPARGEEAVRTLTLEECLALSEANHPDLAGADAKREAERRRLSLTAVEDRVQASANASAARSGREGAPSGSSYTAGVTASVRVFDANRTKYAVEAQRGTLAATEAEGRKTRLQVRYGVKKAYMDLLLAGEVRGQRKESVDSFRLHLERATFRFITCLPEMFDYRSSGSPRSGWLRRCQR